MPLTEEVLLSQLPKDMFEIVRQGAEFYDKVRPFIKEGITSIDQCLSSGSYEYPGGYQVVSRMNGNGTMFVFHGFADVPKSLSIPVDGGHIAAVYALIVSWLFYHDFDIKQIYKVLISSGVTIACCFLVLSTATALSWILAVNQVPQMLLRTITSITTNPYILPSISS